MPSGGLITGRIPNAPRELSSTAQKFWRDYTKAMQNAGLLFECDLETIADLCYWESLKVRARDELPNDKLYLEYKDEETGSLKHIQTHPGFTNLRSIQAQILTLRGKLGLTLSDRSGLKVANPAPAGNMKPVRSGKNW